jgi:diguanylate cyclase (GGDEF)-like protein
MLSGMIDPAHHDFDSAARAVIAFLHQRLGFGLWMVTRAEGDDWIVLQSEDHGYNVATGTVFRWADSFCSRMVRGHGPRVAPDSAQVPAYAAAPIGRQVPIGSYIGAPLFKEDGSLFGTLCAIDPKRQPAAIEHEQELVELLATLLSTILQAELKATQAIRKSERLQVEADTDLMTTLYNRRAWDRLLDREEERCRRYGHPAYVIAVDLDGLKRVNDALGHAAGDDLIIRAAGALRRAARESDVVARIGGDEFVILAVECDRAGADAIVARLRAALAEAQVSASIGMAPRAPVGGLAAAEAMADQRMYEEKRAR